jgi:hypothetical protein
MELDRPAVDTQRLANTLEQLFWPRATKPFKAVS